ncbi:hypothetical protein Syun_022442 [Stephania yunnanensis]|uniref:Uncharacterized protein n=1 Tax=Stephania yunnanensis TaxID=152371 RepID=A0AAP0F707_9MAGN
MYNSYREFETHMGLGFFFDFETLSSFLIALNVLMTLQKPTYLGLICYLSIYTIGRLLIAKKFFMQLQSYQIMKKMISRVSDLAIDPLHNPLRPLQIRTPPTIPTHRHRSHLVLFHLSLLLFSYALSAVALGGEWWWGWGSEGGGVGGEGVCGWGGFWGRYVWSGRWVLGFPIVQRPPLFSFKMVLPSAFGRALRLSADAFICSVLLTTFLPDHFKIRETNRQFFVEHIIFFIGSSVLTLCWELNHHLHQVLHTKRSVFAPPKGSAAAETNPSEPLLAALEESPPKSLLQYLAYLDLCIVCESNVDTWRRAAFFEETGETYKRVVSVCLKPLEQLASELAEGLEGGSLNETDQLSLQLHSNTDRLNAKLHEAFIDMQLYVWCARTLAALTARSHKDDRFGVAQLSGSNAAVLSTLLSCLLAVEASMGKKTNIQAPNLMGPANIKWATLSTGRKDHSASIMGKKKGGPLHAKAYAMADVLRTSIYIIVSEFHDEMMGSTKAGILEKHWIISSKPLYGARDLLVQKLALFLDFRAS